MTRVRVNAKLSPAETAIRSATRGMSRSEVRAWHRRRLRARRAQRRADARTAIISKGALFTWLTTLFAGPSAQEASK